jgi:hypothetical protein
LGFINACRGKWLEAETELAVALSSLPDDAEIWLVHAVYVAQSAGHIARAADEVEAACRLAPLAPPFALNVAAQKILAGDDADALRWIESAIANGVPRGIGPVVDMTEQIARRQGRYADAFRCMGDALSPPLRVAGGAAAIKAFYAAMSDGSCAAKAIGALRSWEDNLQIEDVDLRTAQRLMRWYTLLGAVDLAYNTGLRTLDRCAAGGTVGVAWGLLWMIEMRAFRQDVRFQSFVERLGLIEYWERYGPPDGSELHNGVLICT